MRKIYLKGIERCDVTLALWKLLTLARFPYSFPLTFLPALPTKKSRRGIGNVPMTTSTLLVPFLAFFNFLFLVKKFPMYQKYPSNFLPTCFHAKFASTFWKKTASRIEIERWIMWGDYGSWSKTITFCNSISILPLSKLIAFLSLTLGDLFSVWEAKMC